MIPCVVLRDVDLGLLQRFSYPGHQQWLEILEQIRLECHNNSVGPAVSPDGSVAAGPDDSAERAGQGKFDATGDIPRAQSAGQPMTPCEFGVARAGGSYATVVIKLPDGRTRAIFFRMGKPIGADTSQADGYPEFKAAKENDLNLIRVGDERYEIPDAVIIGG